ncbi:MAG: PD-(D/E)XK nuclease family protein, partial [Phycisphaerae bacterium]
GGRRAGLAGRPAAGDTFRIAALPSRRIEVEYAVAQIGALVHGKETPLRYRDVAIIARDLEPYHELLTEALTARRIPFFIDRRRSIAHHALPELLRSLVDLALNDFKLDDVVASLKTGLWPLPQQGVDELENYLLAQGVNGYRRWTTGAWPATQRNAIRETRLGNEEVQDAGPGISDQRKSLTALMAPWMAAAADPTPKTAAAWSALLGDALNRLGVGRTLEQWAREAEQAGCPDEAAEHRQVQRDCHALLEDFSLALADAPLGLADVRDILESGFSALTLGLTPPTVDQVLVGSIERSRHPEIKAAVVIGFNDGVFPTYAGEDPILNDEDRAALIDGGLSVRPPARERTLDEPLLAYIAATRASERLTITYARADDDGKTLRPSPVIEALQTKLPELSIESVEDAELSHGVWDIQTHADLTRRLVLDVAGRTVADRDPGAGRSALNRLYEQTRGVLRDDPFAASVVRSLQPTRVAALSEESRKRIHAGPFRTSVSQLEKFANCPFKHFAGYLLRLDQRASAELAPVDTGSILHGVLEEFVGGLDRDGPSFQQMDEAQLGALVVQCCERIGDRLHRKRLASRPRDRYRLRRSAAQLTRILKAQQHIARRTPFVPRAAELSFGFGSQGGLPALELATPLGRSVQFRGFIDRVDIAEVGGELLGIVIDYKKTSNKRLHLEEVFHGLALQLTAYLLALVEHGAVLTGRPITPVAALYVRLEARRKPVAHPADVSDRDAAFPEPLRPRGLIRFDKFAWLEPPSEQAGWAKHFAVFRTTKGASGHADKSDAASEAEFGSLLAHTKYKLGQLSDGILDGDIAVRPCRHGPISPCTWCEFDRFCRFEMGLDPIVRLAKMSRSDVLSRLQAGTNVDGAGEADTASPTA